jgi:predicted transcriptional regulator
MTTFTSTLPDDLLNQLSDAAKKLALPKNKLIEKALRIYLNQLKRVEYINSYTEASQDDDMHSLAAEGMAEYLKQIDEK